MLFESSCSEAGLAKSSDTASEASLAASSNGGGCDDPVAVDDASVDGGLTPRGDGGLSPRGDGGVSPGGDGGLSPDVDESGDSQKWYPGQKAVAWVGPQMPLNQQAQALVANVTASIRALPRGIVHQIASRAGMARSTAAVAGWLLGIGERTIDRLIRRLREDNWKPREVLCGQAPETSGGLSPEEQEQKAMTNLVRIAIVNAVEGRNGQEFERDVERHALAGCVVGNKQRSRHFCREVEFIAVRVLQQMDSCDINERLPGIGIPSDVGIVMDPITLGSSGFGRHETVLMQCVSMVSSVVFNFQTRMLAADVMMVGEHSGAPMAEASLKSLANHPAGLGLHALRARCSIVGGDGQVCVGGVSHRHPSGGAAEKIWNALFPTSDALAPSESASPMACTMWDYFHRVDVAASRAVKQHTLATELFDLAGVCDRLFGIDEGRMLFRAVQRFAREAYPLLEACPHSQKKIRAPGGTRKVVYSSGVPGNLVANFRAIITAMHTRVVWRQEGHGVQTLESLTAIGRRLTEPSFVLWMLVFQHILQTIVAPLALAVQSAKEPWLITTALDDAFRSIEECKCKIAELVRFLKVLSLLRQVLTTRDIRSLLLAFQVSPFGRFFRDLWPHLHGLLCCDPPTFQKVRLAPVATVERVLGPHCQCACKENMWMSGGERARRTMITLRRGGLSPTLKVRVPMWVAFPAVEQASEAEASRNEPRWQHRRADVAPPGLLHFAGMFRGHFSAGHTSRCCVPAAVFKLHGTCAIVLERGLDFLSLVQEELRQIFGPVGTNPKMQVLLSNMSVAWSWSELLFQPPQQKHLGAFIQVSRLLRPFLQHSLVPDPVQFGSPESWATVSETELKVEYVTLMRRVRNVAARSMKLPGLSAGPPADAVGDLHASWATLGSLDVQPAWSFSFLVHFFRKVLKFTSKSRPANHVVCCRLGALLSMFLGSWGGRCLPAEAGHVFSILPAAVSAVGGSIGLRRRRRTKSNDLRTVAEGQILALRNKASPRCRLVIVRRVHLHVDSSAVSAALDAHPYFSCGASREYRSAWHAVRLHHRCRLLYAPEATCERMGSYMHYQFRGWKGGTLSPAVLVGRVMLMQAHVRCVGSSRDELLVAELVHIMRHVLHHKAFMQHDGPRPAVQQIEDANCMMRESGREVVDYWDVVDRGLVRPPEYDAALLSSESRAMRATENENACASRLPPCLTQAMQSVTRMDGTIEALPDTVAMAGKRLRRATDSVIRDSLSAWWSTSEGQDWLKVRKAALGDDS